MRIFFTSVKYVKIVKFCSPKGTLGRAQLQIGWWVESWLGVVGRVRQGMLGEMLGGMRGPHEQEAVGQRDS